MTHNDSTATRHTDTLRHVLLWLGVGLMWLVAHLPLGLQWHIGGALGRLMYRLMPKRRRIAAVNLHLCFPELDEQARHKLLRRHFQSLGLMVIDVGLCWWRSDAFLRSLASIEGAQHIERALAQGHGAILLGAHGTSLEMGGHLLALATPHHIQGIYRRHDHPMLEALAVRRRGRRVTRMIPHTDTRALLRALRDNCPVWFAPDQAKRGKHGIEASFFGLPALTNTSTSRLAQVSRAPVLPFSITRDPSRLRYRLVIQPPLEEFPSADAGDDAARLNRLVEEQVRAAPEQYYWVHRRFKAPHGAADPYA